MRRMVVTLVAGLLTVQAGAALAQYSEPTGKFEIIPSVGYRWGGSLNTITGFRSIDTQDNISYGIGLGVITPKNSEAEVAWTHFEGDITAITNGGLTIPARGPLKRDDIMLNGYWYAYHPQASIKPFFTAGLGAAIFTSQGVPSSTKFGWNLGVGFRKDFSEKVALRFAGKWEPVWITTGSGVWCDPFYCYSVGTGENYDQFEVGASLIIKP